MKRFSKQEIFSIPNLMGYFRILMIPIFCYLYIGKKMYLEASAVHYPLMWALILLLIVKEGYMAVMGAVLLKKGKKLNGAMWFGKM